MISEKFSFIGASPDGFMSCDCCSDGCYEIKCPYFIKQEKINDNNDKNSAFSVISVVLSDLISITSISFKLTVKILLARKSFVVSLYRLKETSTLNV